MTSAQPPAADRVRAGRYTAGPSGRRQRGMLPALSWLAPCALAVHAAVPAASARPGPAPVRPAAPARVAGQPAARSVARAPVPGPLGDRARPDNELRALAAERMSVLPEMAPVLLAGATGVAAPVRAWLRAELKVLIKREDRAAASAAGASRALAGTGASREGSWPAKDTSHG